MRPAAILKNRPPAEKWPKTPQKGHLYCSGAAWGPCLATRRLDEQARQGYRRSPLDASVCGPETWQDEASARPAG